MTLSQMTPAHFDNDIGDDVVHAHDFADDHDRALWTVVHEDIRTPLSRDGHLTVSLGDISRIDTIARSGIMQKWARQSEFRLYGIDIRELVSLVMKYALAIADEELSLASPLSENAEAILTGANQETLPDFMVKLHSDFVKTRIISWFDGVEPDSDEMFIALLRRAV